MPLTSRMPNFQSVSADTLFPIVWEAVERLEACGLNVIAFTSDGASSNRKIYKVHGDRFGYKTKNPYHDDQYIYFFSDVPHLMKTTRNCWSNSFSHQQTRALWVTCVFVWVCMYTCMCVVKKMDSSTERWQAHQLGAYHKYILQESDRLWS